jgi:DNA transposition AAA+ family ATPase
VNTSNTGRFLTGLKAVQNRGAEEACLMVVDGQPGLGKTTNIQWWATQTNSVFLRAKKQWTAAWFLHELIETLGDKPPFKFQDKFKLALDLLVRRNMEAEDAGGVFGVVIDEVDHISRRADLLETMRDLSDYVEAPFILVGMGNVRRNLTRFPQMSSRVARYVEFQPATLEDVQTMVKTLCEVAVKPDLIEVLHKLSGGKFREIKEGIKAIETFGKVNTGREIGVAEMAGKILLNDRKSGKPLTVRAA